MRKKLLTGRNLVNASEHAVARSGGLVLAAGIGDLVIDLKKPSTVEFDTEGKIHVYPRAVTQTQEKSSDRVFTSLDRPAPMSPEMMAIWRTQRKNELERERMRSEMERRYEERLSAVLEEVKSATATPVRENSARSEADTTNQVQSGKDRPKGDTQGRDTGGAVSSESAAADAKEGNPSADVDDT